MTATAETSWWVDPGSPGLGRLEAHTIRARYRDDEAALAASDNWRISLDGDWRFQLVGRPGAVPVDFASPERDDSDWDTIPVPGNWTLHADDIPHYTNVRMPWVQEPPNVPEHNPTGLYRTTFDLPDAAQRDRVVLHFGGAESALAVWANGAFVGFHKDSRLPAEFDITEHVSPGRNHVAAMVVRWSDGSWIEDQDHWWMAGLHRSVYVYTTPRTFMRDLVADASLAEDLVAGTLTIDVPVVFENAPEPGWTLAVDFPHEDVEPVSAAVKIPSSTPQGEQSDSVTFRGTRARVVLDLPEVRAWSAERPERYLVHVSLIDPNGVSVEVIPTWVGFMRVEIANRELLLNGQPVLIRGVNRHDHHPERGKAVSADDITEELYAIKSYGFNAVRTAHYPNDPHLLDVCDEIGLYVIDEANIECHARARHLLHEPDFEVAVLDRIRRMVRRDRNHPSIFAWSLGNESGYAPVHDAAAAWVRSTDPGRVVHYEGPMWIFPWSTTPTQGAGATDLVCPMYPSLATLAEWAATDPQGDERPLIMCEFSHAMGNSNGSLSDYWDLIEATSGLQGGFIWDWRDQGLAAVSADGTPYWAFGGHYGDDPNDGNFNCNGIVGSDLRPHPGLWEHLHLARPVDATWNGTSVEVHNRRWFTDLGDLTARFEILIGESVVDEGPLPLPTIAPQGVAVVDVPGASDATAQAASAGTAAHLTVSFHTAHDVAWTPEKTAVAAIQLPLVEQSDAMTTSPGFALPSGKSQQVTATVDETTGAIHLHTDTTAILTRPIELCLWRAPLDNDGIKQGWSSEPGAGPPELPEPPRQRWVRQGLDQLTVVSSTMTNDATSLTVSTESIGTDPSLVVQHRVTATTLEAGCQFDHEIVVPAGLEDLPRVGVRFSLASEFSELTWFGLGPHECYPDRRRSARLGTWSSALADQYEPFPVPQEHGHHLDATWFRLSSGDSGSPSLTCELDAVAGFSALAHHADDLTAALSLADLTASPGTHVHLDAAMRGLGTGSCGPDTLDQYRTDGGVFRLSWRMSASSAG